MIILILIVIIIIIDYNKIIILGCLGKEILDVVYIHLSLSYVLAQNKGLKNESIVWETS